MLRRRRLSAPFTIFLRKTMYELLSGDKRIQKILPPRVADNCKYRMMNYCVSEDLGDEVLLFNLITRQLIAIKKSEKDSNALNKYLIENGFLVPIEFDEYKLYLNLKKTLKRIMSVTRKCIHNFTIFTTTACNAKCYYCFEKKNSIISMNLETANKAADFIFNNVGRNEIANIRWFGGEPLLNEKAINIITEQLRIRGVHFQSSIITNATLFNKKIIQEATSKWNIDFVQVTLDGTKDVHDEIKLISNSNIQSAFDATITNIHHLLNKNIDVQIRLNLSESNKENLFELIDYIDKEFDNKEHLSIYCKTLFEKANGEFYFRKKEDECALRNTQYEINKMIFNLGLYKKLISTILKSSNCAAAIGDVVTILPDGNIGLCEHKGFDENIGNIYQGNAINTSLKIYDEEIPIRVQCKECPVLTECNRQSVCDAVVDYCLKEKQNVMIQEIKMQMRNERKKYEVKV